MVFGYSRRLVNQSLCFLEHTAVDANVVDNGEDKFAVAVVEHKAPRVELVVHVRCERRLVVADDRLSEWRGDVAHRCARAEDFLARGRILCVQEKAPEKKG